jgi:hypothetical protein
MKRRATSRTLSILEVSAEVRAMVHYLEQQGAVGGVDVIMSRNRQLYLRYGMEGKNGIILPCKIPAEVAVFRLEYPE